MGADGVTEIGYASTGFIVWGAALVFIMIPGLGLLYSGLSKTKHSLSVLLASMCAMAVVTVQWILFGFSLTFSDTATNGIIGDFTYAGFTNVGGQAVPAITGLIPIITFALYQLQFAAITPAIIFGSVAERFRLLPAMLFVFLWATFVYDPVAYWTWGPRGWARNLACLPAIADTTQTLCLTGSYDFAGGGPVHISSGVAGLAYAIFIGARKNRHEPHKPHNVTLVVLGTSLLWFGWYGFNGGSATASTARASMAAFVTTAAAASAGLAWLFFDYIFTQKLSAVGFCSGAVAGLVGITPASGFVAPWASIVIGALSAIACNVGIRVKERLGYDDTLDAFGLHAIGGLTGNILTGIFAQKWIGLLDATAIPGGWLDGNWIQVGYQLAGSFAIAGWSFVVSYLLLFLINLLGSIIPALKVRADEEEEDLGLDVSHLGETAYFTDAPVVNGKDSTVV
ncbi:ammonium transporter AmtB-like domain-containing protein [Cladochytrium replicatum]|nr:ammonium transporter AmtB-like domain-containing protein [Cladochytrium replicatum]